MKKQHAVYYIFLVLICIAGLGLVGCELDNSPQIRFQNARSDGGSYTWGVRCGDAIHNGELTGGVTTGYYRAAPGIFPAQYYSIGFWATLSGGNFTIEAGKKYTIRLIGSNANNTLSAAIGTD